MIELSNANTEPLLTDELKEKDAVAYILRLDKLHPVVSGNKWFKLKHYLKEAAESGKKTLITFGGAYSNHIVATAYAAMAKGFTSAGIIRGEKPAQLSPTLQEAMNYGMELFFVSRESFKRKEEDEHIQTIINGFKDAYLIPEGGAGEPGIKGCREILSLAEHHPYSHIICAVGTGTMYAGIVNASAVHQQVIGIPVLKGMSNPETEYSAIQKQPNTFWLADYHFGGYAKKTPALIRFMNDFFEKTGVPTDFVYTGKLMYAFTDLLKKNFFERGSRVLLIHSGGLQGNKSLPEGTLTF